MFEWFRKKPTPSGTSHEKLPEPKDDYDFAILGDIKRVGWSVIQINPDHPGTEPFYSFSLGLFHTHKHPEIILIGLRHEVAGVIINSIGAAVMLGQRMKPGRTYEEFTSVPVAFVEVDPAYYEEYVGYARWLYRGSNFPMLQCVWPLKSGHFPWDKGYDKAGAAIQPLLARPRR